MKHLIKSLLQRYQENPKSSNSPQIDPQDVFLISYPKSGNTWVRFLVSNLLKKSNQEIDFYTVHEQVPEWGKNNDIIQQLTPPRVIKSHNAYQPEYPRIIYIARDGRDVYVSYYYHRLKKLPSDTTFKQFLERQDHYPCLWSEHIQSWLYRNPPLKDLLVVKYEELSTDCFNQLKRIADFIGLEVSPERLQTAVEAGSFEQMRRLETERGRLYSNEGPEVFVRKGKPGNWTELFGEEEKQIFKAREGKSLIDLGYEQDNNW